MALSSGLGRVQAHAGGSQVWLLSAQWDWGRGAGRPAQSSGRAGLVSSAHSWRNGVQLSSPPVVPIAFKSKYQQGLLVKLSPPAPGPAFFTGSVRGCPRVGFLPGLPGEPGRPPGSAPAQAASPAANSRVTLDQSYGLSEPQGPPL